MLKMSADDRGIAAIVPGLMHSKSYVCSYNSSKHILLNSYLVQHALVIQKFTANERLSLRCHGTMNHAWYINN